MSPRMDMPFAPQPPLHHPKAMAQLIRTDEATQAREQTAQRLERLARLVRSNTTASVEELDQAYAAIVKLAAQLRPLLLNQ